MNEDFFRILLNSMTRIFIIRIVTCILRHILAIKNIFFIVHNHGARISVKQIGTILAIFSLVSRCILEFSRVYSKKCAFFPMRAQFCCLINLKFLSKTPLTHSCPVIDQYLQSFALMCVKDGTFPSPVSTFAHLTLVRTI